jgi:hypothetical protein
MNDDENHLTFDGVTYVPANDAVLMVMLATRYSGGGAYRKLVMARKSGEVRMLAVSSTQRWFALDDVQALVARLQRNANTAASTA